jgi:hypothetical protein
MHRELGVALVADQPEGALACRERSMDRDSAPSASAGADLDNQAALPAPPVQTLEDRRQESFEIAVVELAPAKCVATPTQHFGQPAHTSPKHHRT